MEFISVYVHDNFEKMTMYSREEVIGRNCRFMQGRYTNKETTRQVREAVEKGEALDVELLNYRKDGSPFWNRYIACKPYFAPRLSHMSLMHVQIFDVACAFID